MATMSDRIQQIREEKVRFERILEELGFERLNVIRLSENSYKNHDKNSNGNKNDRIQGFITDNGYDSGYYTQTYIKDPEDQYSGKPKICLELKVQDGIGTQMSIYSVPYLPHYNFKNENTVNRKEILRLLKKYFS